MYEKDKNAHTKPKSNRECETRMNDWPKKIEKRIIVRGFRGLRSCERYTQNALTSVNENIYGKYDVYTMPQKMTKAK